MTRPRLRQPVASGRAARPFLRRWRASNPKHVAAAEIVRNGELAVFEEANGALELEALEESGYVFGSAVKHPHPLVLGTYSIHTSRHALEKGEARIREIGAGLQTENRR